MARVHKMMMQGIRSYGPENDDQQYIQFYTPLTLILGQNGCGKTTIIECLKYAIGGDMPPGCAKGGGFIFDPRLARQPEVRAKVMLKLFDAKEKELIVSRTMQLTQKKRTATMKSLDATITRKGPDGKSVQTSGRCVDIDMEMLTSLGVTKAIINSVIFCHQEESSWPLEEGKKLKERFDAIFDTEKHNKCLKNIGDIRKAVQQELNVLKSDLNHLHDKKKAASRLNDEIEDTQRRIQVAQDQMDNVSVRCEPLDQRLKEIQSVENDVMTLYTKQENLKTQIKSLREQQAELEKMISSPFVGSIEDLKDAITSFRTQVDEKDAQYRDLLGRIERSEGEERRLGEDMSQAQKKIGQLESENQQYQKCIQERNRGLEKLAREFEFQVESLASASNVRSAMERLEQEMQTRGETVDKLKRELEAEEQKQQSNLDSLRDSKVKLEQEIKMKEDQIRTNDSEVRKAQLDIKEIERSTSRLAQVERELGEVKTKLEQAEGEVNVQEEKLDIQRFEADEQGVSDELEKIYKEVQQLQLHSHSRTQLSLLKEQHSVKQSDYNRLKNKNGDTLKHLLKTIPEFGIKKEFQICTENLTQEIRDKNNELRTVQSEVSKLEVNRRHKKEQVDSKEKELKDDEEKIYERCEEKDLEDVIKDLGDKIQEMRDLKGMLTSQEVLFKQYTQKIQERDPCCPLCHRDFHNVLEAMALVEELNSEVRNVPTRLRNNNEKLEKSVREYDALLQLRPTYERINTFKQSLIPKLKKELKDMENNLKSAREQVETLQEDLMSPQIDEEMAKKMQNDIVLMDQSQIELRRLDLEIKRLESQLPAGVSARSLEEAIEEQDKLRKELSCLQQSIKGAKRRLEDHTNKVQKLRERKNQLVEEQLKAHGGAQQLKQMQSDIARLEAQGAMLEEEVELQQADLTVASRTFEEARRAVRELLTNNRLKLDKEQSIVMSVKQRCEEVRKWHQAVVEMERRGLSTKLQDARQSFTNLERERQAVRTRHKDLTLHVDTLKADISGQQVRQRELTDNLKLREKEQLEEQLVQEMAVLTQRIGGLKFNQLRTEKERLLTERTALTKEAQQAEGRMDELQKQLVTQRREMAQDMFRDADKKYSAALRQKTVKEIANDDLLKYYKAMDWAMMHFHQERMKVINQIIHDLWRAIYRGNDIDFIQIRADVGEAPADGRKRRTYDYRVVQIKNDAEIDMRNRCSAGQKVLACLVIRIALAETLSAQCGILALDEPTTNLDRENIDSLADALVQLVNTRMVNKNFQLIVITHDEEFVHHMRQVNQLLYYYIVTRNEKGKSQVKKHALDHVA